MSLMQRIECTPWMRWSVVLFFSVLIGQLTWFYIEPLFEDRRPPITIHDIYSKTKVVRPGQAVTISIDRTKVRDCALRVDTFWINRKGEEIFDKTTRGGRQGLGRKTVVVVVEVPGNLPTGEWGWQALLLYDCENGTAIVRQQAVWFTVR